MNKSFFYPIIGVVLFIILSTGQVFSEQLCQQITLIRGKLNNKTRLIANGSKCPKGFTRILSSSQLELLRGPIGATGATGVGQQGLQGNPGVDGTLRVYGDGSAGPLAISGNVDWATTPPINNNLQFTNFTILTGATLTIPTGTVIRATESINVEGTLVVMEGASGARNRLSADSVSAGSPAVLNWAFSPPIEGQLSHSPAQFGQKHNDSTVLLIGGFGGLSYFNVGTALGGNTSLLPVNFGTRGGSGGSGFSAGDGGGIAYLFARGSIVVQSTGIVRANGDSGGFGGGGGGGGILVIASPVSVTNSGQIEVKGGNGGSAGNSGSTPVLSLGNGGGGGGGLVHIISPSIVQGTIILDGGTGGSSSTTLNQPFRAAGGGGGASGGNGGNGGNISAGASVAASSGIGGGAGKVVQTVADPTSLIW